MTIYEELAKAFKNLQIKMSVEGLTREECEANDAIARAMRYFELNDEG